jgi:glycine/D-amino acid oxidase-like deaminating enzyme
MNRGSVKLRSKEPYWLLKNGIIDSYPSLKDDVCCDVLIVGGGITGALLGYQFSSEGYKTVLIDKRDIGFGSTSATTCMIQYELDEPLHTLMDRVGKRAALDTYYEGINVIKELSHLVALFSSESEFDQKESIQVASCIDDLKKLRKEHDCRRNAGINVRWLSKGELMERYGVVGEGAIFSPLAASLDPYRFTHSILKYSTEKYGLKVYDHTTLEKVDYDKTENKVKVDSTVTITCRHIVYATGYESHEVFRSNIGKLISTYACISEPISTLPGSLKNTLFWNTEDPYFYCRATDDNRLLIGGEDECFKDTDKRDALIEKKECDLVKKVSQFIPDMKFVADFTWAGTFGVTKDSLPYVGAHPEFPNSYFLLAFGGNGITFSLMGMRILSDALAGRPNKFLEYFKFNR